MSEVHGSSCSVCNIVLFNIKLCDIMVLNRNMVKLDVHVKVLLLCEIQEHVFLLSGSFNKTLIFTTL